MRIRPCLRLVFRWPFLHFHQDRFVCLAERRTTARKAPEMSV